MEKVESSGSRQLNLKKSFKLGLQSLLTACSKEEFCAAFPTFTDVEKEGLHRLYVQAIASLHHNIEDEFESLCLETQVGNALDTVEEIVEEQTLNPLFPDKSNIQDIARSLATAKKNEVQRLMGMLEKAEEQKRMMKDRIEMLKKERVDLSGPSNLIDQMRKEVLDYGTANSLTLQRKLSLSTYE